MFGVNGINGVICVFFRILGVIQVLIKFVLKSHFDQFRAINSSKCSTLNSLQEKIAFFAFTWRSPNGKTVYQIDHLMIDHRWWRSLLDVCVFMDADLYTDNYLVVRSIRMKLNDAYQKKCSKKRYDESRHKNEKIQKEYSDWLRSCLSTSTNTCLTGKKYMEYYQRWVLW